MIKSDKNSFIEKSITLNQDKYDYSLTEYELSSKKVKIICKIHGEFLQHQISIF
jgi:hypothetical protein